ncbi:6-carboxyhexanoate--CoA ligase [Bacillus alkalicellulosilyticus]|uniref:6-carboxyhexanoate--CoA ligase n=1 Tax=Alkalihalobacterium alkalicellulosilyticum TaxID=1912214 RepID=UPI0009974F63|nr:6-carboxyhexanoate--CoA ligase [Bacillus alkalicellulosilyticus]
MDNSRFYSVRMRASENQSHEKGGKHISGGELISSYQDLKKSVDFLLEKALTHSRGKPDFLQIQCELIDQPITQVPPLTVKTIEVSSVEEGQQKARKLLEQAGVSKQVIEKAYAQIPDEAVRGAILIDCHTGKRIDGRKDRGVRVSRMDWERVNFEKWVKAKALPLNQRIKEALVLATKVSTHQATVAELCWSDDPEYVTGYVASKTLGYQRITKLKPYGDERGCRIFFVDTSYDLDTYITYLEKQPMFIQWEEDDVTRPNRKK